MKKENIKKRESNLELLRIIAMMMIVFHHFAVHGNFNFDTTNIGLNCIWYIFIAMGGKIGVNIFVLISGYFLVKPKNINFDLKHIFKFLFQVLFYSIIISLIFYILSPKTITLDSIKETILPLISKRWWFPTNYFILYLLHPFINKTLINLTKKEYKTLLLILIFCFSIIPTLISKNFLVSDIVWFITLYCIAGYIKLFGLPEKIKCHHYFISCLVLIIITFLLLLFDTYTEVFEQNKLNTLLLSTSIFMMFTKIKIKHSKLINLIASATFGVYLIHDEDFVREFLWLTLFKNANFQESSLLIPYSIMVCIWVYITCTIIELLRKKIIEKPFLKLIDNIQKQKL